MLRDDGRAVAYEVMARGAGYPRAFAYGALEKLSRDVAGILDQPGPVFVALKVAPEVETSPIGQRRRWQTRNREQVIEDLREALGIAT